MLWPTPAFPPACCGPLEQRFLQLPDRQPAAPSQWVQDWLSRAEGESWCLSPPWSWSSIPRAAVLTYILTHTHTHIHTRARTHTQTRSHTLTHTHTLTHAQTHARTHAHARTHSHYTETHSRTTHTHTYARAAPHARTHTRLHTHTHTHTRTHTHCRSVARWRFSIFCRFGNWNGGGGGGGAAASCKAFLKYWQYLTILIKLPLDMSGTMDDKTESTFSPYTNAGPGEELDLWRPLLTQTALLRSSLGPLVKLSTACHSQWMLGVQAYGIPVAVTHLINWLFLSVWQVGTALTSQ